MAIGTHRNMATGYDCDFVDGPPKELHWECAICLLTLRQPYLVDCCGNHFCKACLDRINEENKTVCPLCKHEEFKSIPNKGLERQLNQRKVYCTHKKSGCEWTGELRQLDSHVNDVSASVKGTSQASKEQPSSPNTTDPLFIGCQFVEVSCRYCPATVLRGQMKKHLNTCPNKPLKCKYCKSFAAPSKELEERHHPVCPKFPLPCPNKCGAEIQRKNMAKHLSTTCPLSKLECEYVYVGCTCVLPCKKMESHVKSASGMAAHLALMEKAYGALKQSKSEGKDREELAQQVESLELEKADLEADHFFEVRRLEDKNAALEERVQHLSAEVRGLRAENQRLKKKLNDYYKISDDSDSDDIDYGASYNPTSSFVKPKPKKTVSSNDSGVGWGAAALAGLGLVGAVGAAALASRSSSSDEKKKSNKDSSWF